MYKYAFGSVVLIPFPFTDLTSAKVRPAMILSVDDQDATHVTVAFITSKKPAKIGKGSFLLSDNDKDFSATGLKVDSLIRFDKLASLEKSLVLGRLGMVSSRLAKTMKESFEAAFGF